MLYDQIFPSSMVKTHCVFLLTQKTEKETA